MILHDRELPRRNAGGSAHSFQHLRPPSPVSHPTLRSLPSVSRPAARLHPLSATPPPECTWTSAPTTLCQPPRCNVVNPAPQPPNRHTPSVGGSTHSQHTLCRGVDTLPTHPLSGSRGVSTLVPTHPPSATPLQRRRPCTPTRKPSRCAANPPAMAPGPGARLGFRVWGLGFGVLYL